MKHETNSTYFSHTASDDSATQHSQKTTSSTSAACSRENLVFVAAGLAFYLSQGLSRQELETLTNLINITSEMLDAILAQRDIDENPNTVFPIL